jgi:spore coat protein U-like protein
MEYPSILARQRTVLRSLQNLTLCGVFLLLCMALFAGDRAAAQSCNTTDFDGSYGTINVLSGAAIDSTSTFTVTCTGTANQTVRLCIEIGPGDVNGSEQRVLDNNEDLRHEFYTDLGRTTIWGSWGAQASIYVPYPYGKQVDLNLGASGSASTVQTVYARIFGSQQTVNPSTYSWSSTAPRITYGYAGAANCPTGSRNDDGGTTSWNATVAVACNVSATNINFGTVAALSSIVDATGTITVQCSDDEGYSIGLNAGTGAGATVTTRKMTAGANTVNYTIYRNSTRTSIWGNTIGSNTVSSTGTGGNQNFTAYARIPVQATPPPTTYNDTITVTVTY